MATMNRLAVGSLLAALAASGIFGGEPDGRLEIRYVWVSTGDTSASGPSPGAVGRVRLTIRSVATTFDAVVHAEVPPGIVVVTPNGQGLAGVPIGLGDLGPGEIRVLEFDVRAPPTGGGIVAFRVTAEDEARRAFAEGIGVAVGSPGETPQLRHSAREYRARAPSGGDR